MTMKDKLNMTLLVLWILSALGCIAGVLFFFDLWLLGLLAVPCFCSQLLACRVSRRWWVRGLPALPALLTLILAVFYAVRDNGWDRLSALIFALIGAVCVTGVFFGWVAFLPQRNNKQDKNEQ